MRCNKFSIFCMLLLLSLYGVHSQAQCEDKIGFNNQGHLSSKKSLDGYLSKQDTALKMFLFAAIIKSERTNGITLYGIFSKIGIIDNTTKVKFTFNDNTSVILSDYLNTQNNPNPDSKNSNIGFFSTLITDKYNLLLLKTKLIKKVQITGLQLDASTYLVDEIIAQDFLLGMNCLQHYL